MKKKIVILDGYASNPGDLSWEELERLGDLTVYDRTPPELLAARIADAQVIFTNKVPLDAAAMQAARAGVLAGTISIACRYVHSACETISLADCEGAKKMLVAFLRQPGV